MAGSAVIGSLRVNLGLDSAAFSSGLKKTEGAIQKFGRFAKTGLLAAGAAATAAAGAMGLMVRNSINAADEMSKTAQKIGIPIEELSRLKYAADLAGVSFGGLQTGVKKLSQNMNDALAGTGEGAEAFEQLGISVADADGKLKSSTEVMSEIADKFAAMPDGAEKTALAMDLMGRAGTDMIPLLNGGTEALQKMLAEADTFGQVFTQEMGSSAEAFNDNMSRLAGAFGNLAARIARDLLPHLERFSAWLVENAPAIQQWASTILGAFVQFGQDLAQLKAEIDAIITGFQQFRDAVTARVNEIKATLTAFANEIVGVFSAIPAQMYQIGVDILTGLWNGLKSQASSVIEGAKGIGSRVVDGFKGIFQTRSPSKVMAEVGKNVMEGLAQGMDRMKGDVEGIAGNIASTVSNAFKGLISGSMTVKEVLQDLLSQLASVLANQGFQALFSAGGGGGGGFLGGLFSGIGKLFGFANGGRFQVGGAGGIDSQLVAFRASPNETVNVTKPGQDMGGGVREIIVRGVFVDDNGVITGQVTSMGQQAAQAGAAVAVRQVNQGLPSMIADAQSRKM